MSTLFIKGLAGSVAAGMVLIGGGVTISEINKSNLNNAIQTVQELRKSVKEEVSDQVQIVNKEITTLKEDNYQLSLDNDKEAQKWSGTKAVLRGLIDKLKFGKSRRRYHGGYQVLHDKVDEAIKELENISKQ